MRLSIALIALTALFLTSCAEPADKGRPSGAWSSLNWMTAARAYPKADIPSAGFGAAFELKGLVSKADNRNTEPWEALGPHNVAGRMLSLAFNPENLRTLWAGSASGGLWRSYSGGEGVNAWHRVATGFPVLSASAIAFAPDDSNVVYLGTGEVYNPNDRDGRGVTYRPTRGSYGLGVLVSRDGGASWEKSLDWSAEQGRGVNMIVTNPLRPQTVWAATTEGLMVTYDAGGSWIMANPVRMATDLAIHAADTSRVFASHGNLGSTGHGIYRSTDGGISWHKLSSGLPSSFGGKALLTIAPSDANTIYSTIGNGFRGTDGNWLVRSVDGGDEWETMHSATNFVGSQGWYSHDVAVHPDDPDRITVVGFLIYTSDDGGRVLNPATEWLGWTTPSPQIGQHDGPSNYSHPDNHAIVVSPENSDRMLFVTDGGIYRTDDGQSFRALNGGLQTVQFYPGMSTGVQVSDRAIAGTQDNSTLLYAGSPRWRILQGGDGAWTAIDPALPNRVYWSSQYLNMRRSSDTGLSFEGIAPPDGNRLTGFVAPFALSPANPNWIYAGRDRTYLSRNRGGTWSTGNAGAPLTGEPLVSIAPSHTNANTAFAITAPGASAGGRVFVTRNAGATWTDVTGPLPDRYLFDLAVDPTNDDRVFLTVAGFGSGHLFRTLDGGQTWQAAGSGLPDLPTWAVVIDPEFTDTIYAGNDVGVFVSTNGGDSWEPFDSGLPEALIAMDLGISPADRKLRVATHGNGMFERQLEVGSAVSPEGPIAQQFSLLTVFPNPASGPVTATYVLQDRQRVEAGVFDAAGRLVLRLASGTQASGRVFQSFDVSALPAGSYYLRAALEEVTLTTPLTVVR
jgi:photosystem II stability/assembly factor-like uncharacterized protein